MRAIVATVAAVEADCINEWECKSVWLPVAFRTVECLQLRRDVRGSRRDSRSDSAALFNVGAI